ncbi:VOC family protein [Paracoccus benzoatiresistens]|uniref:VOC family protein n=1 Tax=Paracoccus benzoatiresistens TaxID=2997341 RepID=A0ABT4J6G6_9RHOB|nr:VOC family protein [Paracoccus sp. EF6]MCZ0962707.1 VOC family protein [Paracoccus sp. EF6]
MIDKNLPIIDHVHLRSVNLDKAILFYQAIFRSLGRDEELKVGRDWLEIDGFYLDQADEDCPPSRIHLAFVARSRDEVDAFHTAGLSAGGRDNGAPGLRDYHPGYYAAYVCDPDGNNIEAKFDERPA